MMKKTMIVLSVAFALAGHSNGSFAQGNSVKELPRGWHLLDKEKDGYFGISLEKAYDFVKGKKSTPIIVAVIDSGVDTLHEDLKSVLWRNPKEIPGNGIDDDKNGYVDDIYGWNFLGGRDEETLKKILTKQPVFITSSQANGKKKILLQELVLQMKQKDIKCGSKPRLIL